MRQLLAIRTHGSFAKAADVLGMSQPSLSTAIARLEDQLKVRLFERTPQGSRLTPIGELIAERSGKVVAEAEQIVRDAALVAGGEAGTVRIGVGTSLKHNFLPRFVLALAAGFPLLSISFQLLDRDRLIPLVKARELDLVICAVGDDIEDEGLIAAEVLTAEALAVAHPGHALVGERRVSRMRFSEFPSAGPALRQFSSPSLLGMPFSEVMLTKYESNDFDPLLELALAGHATLIAPSFVVQPYLESGRLGRIDLDWEYRVSFAAIATRAASYSPIISRIIRHAEAIGAELRGRPGSAPGIGR